MALMLALSSVALGGVGSSIDTAITSPDTAATAAPAVYWAASPTLANETLLLAGAGLANATVRLCKDAACATVVAAAPAVDAWQQSLKVTMPVGACGPPCYAEITGSVGGAKTTVAVNAPDVWWGLSGAPSQHASTAGRAKLSNEPLALTVGAGDSIRVFGRSIAWSADGSCVSAALEPAASATTQLMLQAAADGDKSTNSGPIAAASASCYEASFDSVGLAAGQYTATVRTAWGVSDKLALTIAAPVSSPPPHRLDVAAAFDGNLTAAIAHAATLTAVDATAHVEVILGSHTYQLKSGITLPNRTSLIGSGANGETALEFLLRPPDPPPGPRESTCSKPILADFYTTDCAHRGCHVKACPGCFLEIGVSHSAGNPDGCCAACTANRRCNAWTFIGSVDLPGGYCSLSACPDEPTATRNSSCASTPSHPGLSNRTSGWVLGRKPLPPPAPAAIVANGHGSRLVNFSLRIKTAVSVIPRCSLHRSFCFLTRSVVTCSSRRHLRSGRRRTPPTSSQPASTSRCCNPMSRMPSRSRASDLRSPTTS
jgi:hypothetical protein